MTTPAATVDRSQLQEKARQGSPWVYRPWLDLLIGAGGWSAPLLLLAYALGASRTQAAATAFYALALLFNNPHYMATVYRAYRTVEERRKYRFFTLYTTAFLAAVGALAHFYYPLLPWLFTIYITWSPWHYAGQNYGLMMMFVRRNQVAPADSARRALYGAFVASYLMLFLSFHARPSLDPLVLSLGLPERAGEIGRIVCGAAFAILGIYALASISRQASLRKLAAPLTLFATQFLWFVLPSILELAYGVRLPQTRYSTGILALMHSAQYLWITSYYAQRESEAAAGRWRGLSYFATLVVGGIALFVPGPWLVSYLFHYDFSSSFLIFVSLINIHHFVLDGAIWKLRDGRIATLLLGGRDQVAAVAKKTLSGPLFNRLRKVAAAGLLLWAALDQFKFHAGQSSSDPSKLMQIAGLNPYDASLLNRLAESELRAGHPDDSLAALRRAASLAGSTTETRKRFIVALLQSRLFAEANAQNQQLRASHAADAAWLVNFGLAVEQLGQIPAARESWRAAMQADPHSAAPALCLAQSLQHEGHPGQAAPYYDQYLQLVVKYPEQNRPDAVKMSAILIESAASHVGANQLRPALQQYREAIQLASREGNQPLQATGYSGMAELQSRIGDVSGALHSYQSTLKLNAGDPSTQAADWFNYGLFLNQHRYPIDLAYACVRKAEDLATKAGSSRAQLVTQSRLELAKELGKRLPQVDHNFQALALQAASLSP